VAAPLCFYSYANTPAPHSFPTRRSSDLDLARQVALRHRGGDLGDVAHLAGQVGRHRVHRVGEVLPGPGHARHHGLAAELALGAQDRKSTRLNSSHVKISYAVFCLKKKTD